MRKKNFWRLIVDVGSLCFFLSTRHLLLIKSSCFCLSLLFKRALIISSIHELNFLKASPDRWVRYKFRENRDFKSLVSYCEQSPQTQFKARALLSFGYTSRSPKLSLGLRVSSPPLLLISPPTHSRFWQTLGDTLAKCQFSLWPSWIHQSEYIQHTVIPRSIIHNL